MATKPIHEIRLGVVKAAVWSNETDKGVLYNVTVARVYRKGDTWKTSDSFGRDELLLLAKVVDQAHTWICQQQQQEKSPPSSDDAEQAA